MEVNFMFWCRKIKIEPEMIGEYRMRCLANGKFGVQEYTVKLAGTIFYGAYVTVVELETEAEAREISRHLERNIVELGSKKNFKIK